MFEDAPRELSRPDYLPSDNWDAIVMEQHRLHLALEDEDSFAIIGAAKSLVESVARVILEVGGRPAADNDDYTKIVSAAHNLIREQPGNEFAQSGPFASIASSANKMALKLGEIRNSFGTGHGRSRLPKVIDEMVLLSLDGAMIWVRWALRRLGPLAFGRPGPLIDDLVNGSIFHSGDLRRRIEYSRLSSLEDRHQRAVGVAVGRRVATNTFVVRQDGLDPCLNTDIMDPWTINYRQGVATGLLEDEDGKLSLSAKRLEWLMGVIDPVPDNSLWLTEWVERFEYLSHQSSGVHFGEGTEVEIKEVLSKLQSQIMVRPEAEKSLWRRLYEVLRVSGE